MTEGWTQFYYLVFYFIAYSIGGWAVESIYRSICEKRLINSGFMYGPYCPIYGFGTLIMILILQNLKGDITLLFVVSFVVLSIWEYFVGVYLEKVYHAKYWDYSNHKINFKGRICLTNSVYWGILGVVFTLFIHPAMAHAVSPIPMNIVFWVDWIVGMTMLTDFIISSIRTHEISKKLAQIKALGEKIKEKLSKAIANTQANKTENKKLSDADLEQLELQHNKLRVKLYKQLSRIKNAFPSIQSEAINKFLSEKIDIKDLKNKIKELNKHLKEKRGPKDKEQ